MNQMQESVKINVNEIPQAEYDIACSILATSVRRFFEKPGVKEAYEKWKKSEATKERKRQWKQQKTELLKKISRIG